jgi:8-oxo-dGTP pyrophosphatase MutT (NUDIX family)
MTGVGVAMAPWDALAAAVRRTGPRVGFHVDGRPVGSVAQLDVGVLSDWPQWIALDGGGVQLLARPHERSKAFASINAGLRERGLIRAWRDESFGLVDPASGVTLATLERASMRFWGALTRGAHCNGFQADEAGRPARLWIARRSPHKAVDPGRLDNLIGGGIAHGQTPGEALVREGWEEAGLGPHCMREARPGSVIRIDCDVPEGRVVEHIHVFDLELPLHVVPRNQDGEVAEFRLMSVAEAVACAAEGAMTVDAALVTLDFLLRRRLLDDAQHALLESRMAALRVAGGAG